MLGALMRRNMSQKLSVLLLVFGLVWGLMLLRYTVQQPRHQSSAELREQILELSRRYVKVLTEENQRAPGGPQGATMAGYADLKRTIAVLLDDILERLVKLEGKLEVVVNASVTNTSHGGVLASASTDLQGSSKHERAGSHPGMSRFNQPRTPSRPQLHL
ncbi:coiled-coil domain-containing protein 126 isoform X2 [Dunckerocampus dactyliophorus]|uniref:coiled-coil domain-containing protein 126 isoform X2 n=1 Tax=Dunckerocampus dactyliophorus TaxID=161453 RepID=UPI00240669C2|nr:coiled-coil domain-containing protein 126 isoform X2 [Dunckerocampus dactyliophorus]XP_054619324.1 coiled-coil domain-containing protein 126 isoform X2 [Dunckerocampus dactyliophorus]XP_054619325.1 coiled-coil domain-containing protein 126 isoform X2 [Dunckerocampus dactyliophorus]XP_054619326.1 coiled-coil domain-containing protein 126 isoform X2 [Dunckerocampus dactyliophorus]XP_054619327.1 coiled-coil domain-containing protein 126 isoform X2 [Dunckerocampus dactyliophorus]XP_054619328.1 